MEATAARPSVSLSVLRSGFAQWERPNRRQTIASLYADLQKANAGRPVAAAPSPAKSAFGAFARVVKRQPSAPVAAPSPAEARAPKHRKPIPPVIVFAAAGVVFTAVLLALVFMAGPAPAPAETADASSIAESAIAETTANVEAPVEPVAEIATAQPGEPAVAGPPAASAATTPAMNSARGGTSTAPVQPSAARSGTVTAGTTASSRPAAQAGRPPGSAQPLQPAAPGVSAQPSAAPAPPPRTRLALDPSRSSVVPIQPIEAGGAHTAGAVADDDLPALPRAGAPIYSGVDSTVLAPVTLSTLPPAAEPGTPDEDLAVLELVIAPTGRVESARLLNTVQHFRDRWWIAAAKTWAFQPALLNGQPVRYRTRLTFMNGAATGPPVADR
jgi:hypothetical protein